MNKENSLYAKELEVMKLQEIYREQEKFLANKTKLDQLSNIKKCLQIISDLSSLLQKFPVESSNEPYLNIDRASACNLQQLSTNLIQLYAEKKEIEGVSCCSDLERSVNSLGASLHKSKEHLDVCQSIVENFETIAEKLQK